MPCPICDQKPGNCDCPKKEIEQHERIEELEGDLEVARLRLVAAQKERECVLEAIDGEVWFTEYATGCGEEETIDNDRGLWPYCPHCGGRIDVIEEEEG